MIKKLFNWIFREELNALKQELRGATDIRIHLGEQRRLFDKILNNIDVSVDCHEFDNHASSWAVISLQGQKSDYIKFVDLGNRDIREIGDFLRQFERLRNIKVDASPRASAFLKFHR